MGLQQKFKLVAAQFFLIGILVCFNCLSAVAGGDSHKNVHTNIVESIIVTRSQKNPLITFSSSLSLGRNINGPSVIKVPAWIKKPLGKYYMYFAHHKGKSIRLAYSDFLEGPWSIYDGGTLQLDQAPGFIKHVASPDVHIDNDLRRIIMYFHGPMYGCSTQKTGVAFSNNGLDFHFLAGDLGRSYFRVFRYKENYYAIDVEGNLYTAKSLTDEWTKRKKYLIAKKTIDDQYGLRTNVRIRHSAVLLHNENLLLFYTMKEDAPERIYMVNVKLTDNWEKWQASYSIEVLRPAMNYEGTHYPIQPSRKGKAINVQQLRDPCIFQENGSVYLFTLLLGKPV